MKTIFITGASSELGNATARLFADHGWKVIAAVRRSEEGVDLVDIDNLTLLRMDVTRPKQIAHAVAAVTGMGDIDVVFNNAGYGPAGSLEGGTDKQMLRLIDTSLLGAIRVTEAFIPYFKNRGSGLFISTTFIGGLSGFPFGALYDVTKWGLEGWSEGMAFELKNFGIGVKTILPGAVRTNFTGRSADHSRVPAYDGLLSKVMTSFGEVFSLSSAEETASVVYEAATDGKEQMRYVSPVDGARTYFEAASSATFTSV
jgi:NAD(P)-dependent dehydrogenase (short-subunit alcohol dehydrogenase family)